MNIFKLTEHGSIKTFENPSSNDITVKHRVHVVNLTH